jgi:hypothetical protein
MYAEFWWGTSWETSHTVDKIKLLLRQISCFDGSSSVLSAMGALLLVVLKLVILLLYHFPYAFLRRRIFSFLLIDPSDIW